MNWLVVILAVMLLVEAVVQAIKPILGKGWQLSISEIVAIGCGVLSAVLGHLNVLDSVCTTSGAVWWIGCVLTGIVMGRGSSYAFDLSQNIKSTKLLDSHTIIEKISSTAEDIQNNIK